MIPELDDSKYKMMVKDTPGDLARGTLCRLCAGAAFANWEDFKNFTIHLCRHCGDFFARSDPRKYHETRRPPERLPCHQHG
jgi:hypothetical protein